MLKRLIPVFMLLFAFTVVGSAFADTEDEIVARYLQKTEKKVVNHVGFVSGHFSYGFLSDDNGYNEHVDFLATSEFAGVNGTISPNEGIFRTNEIALNLGMMVKKNISLQFGFEYWMNMGNQAQVDYTTTIGVLEDTEVFNEDSKVSVWGGTVGFDYYLLNSPNNAGILPGIALKLGGGGGFYSTSWNIWRESDTGSEPIKASAPGGWIHAGLEYPTPLFDMVLGFNAGYFYLNFGEFSSYNENGGDLSLSYTADGEKLAIDFSGPRVRMELKRYLKW